MHKILKLLVVLSLFLSTGVTAQEKVQIVSFEYPPIMSATLPYDGLMGEIVHESFKKENVEIKINFFPPRRFLTLIRTNIGAAYMCPLTVFKRDDVGIPDVNISPPIVNIVMVLIYHTSKHKSVEYNNLKELAGYDVVVIRGSNTTKILKDAGLNVTEVSIESQIKMLKQKRIDLAAVGLLMGNDMIKNLFPDDIENFKIVEKPIMALPTTLSFNNKSGMHLKEKFYQGFKKLRKSGEYIKILKKYYGEIPIVHYKEIFKELDNNKNLN